MTPHTAARLARGGMRWARWHPVGGGTDRTWGWGLDSPRGTLTGLEWRGLTPLAHLTVLPGPPRLVSGVLGRQGLARSRSMGNLRAG